MTVNYTSLLSLGQPVTGTESGTWGDDVNNALTAYLDIAIAGTLTFTGDGAVTLSNTQGTNSASNISSTTAQYSILKVVGPLTATKVFTAPSTSKTYIVNNTDATYGVTIKAFGQTGVTVAANRKALVMFNGTDYAFVSGDDITKFLGTLPVSSGGTGQTTFTDGQLLIGNSSGNTLTKATLTAGANVTITNGPGSIQISAPSLGGTVTSVGQTFTGGLISVSGSPVTSSGTLALTVAGTSGGIPYFSSGTTWASSNVLASNALMVGGGAGAAPSTITTGTGVTTALGVNTGSSGAFVVNGGALGTPSSGTLTSCTDLPVSTGVSGLGTGVATALAINPGTSGSVVVNGGALGTPSSGTLTSCTGLPVSTGVSGLGTGVATALAVNTGSSGAFVVNGGALGTPSSGTLSSCTGLPVSTGVSGLGTGVATALAVNTGTAGAFVVNGGALGTPSSGTVTNLTGTASININGTVGATTPNTGAFTTISASGQITGSDGTAGAPAYSFASSGNSDNGMYLSASNEVSWATSGTKRLTLTSDGRFYGTALHNNAGAVTGTTNQYIASGTYTPTVTNILNVSSSTTYVCQWMRVGNVVTVSGKVNITPSASDLTGFYLSVPIASTLSANNQCGGVGSRGTGTNTLVSIYGGSPSPVFAFTAPDTNGTDIFFNFTYLIV